MRQFLPPPKRWGYPCCKLIDEDIGETFVLWLTEGHWTARGKVFDVGNSTMNALMNIQRGKKAIEAGGTHIHNNGNGSLMRIPPLAFYLYKNEDNKFEIIKNVSSITHGHNISIIACSIYIELALNILKGLDLQTAYNKMQETIKEEFKGFEELDEFSRILDGEIYSLSENEIKSSGYVLDTLEASLWCLFNSSSYKEAVLKAVNLGDDTDTTGAVTGGIAGLYYGYDDIPKEWLKFIAKKGNITQLGKRLYKSLK